MSPLQESMSDALSLTIPLEQWPVGLSCPVDGELLESLHHWAPSTRHIEEARQPCLELENSQVNKSTFKGGLIMLPSLLLCITDL